MSKQAALEVHLYGKLRRFAQTQQPDEDSIIPLQVDPGETIADVLGRIGIPLQDVGANIFYNWQYSGLERVVGGGGRLAVFPDDMQLLYKWYFKKEEA